MGYEKLYQACCSYGCIGSHIPLAYKMQSWAPGTWGPGYEALDYGQIRIPYDNGPLPNSLLLRCEWSGSAGGVIGWLVQRWVVNANGDQDQIKFEAFMSWPEKGAWASFWVPGFEQPGPCHLPVTLILIDFDSADGLMTAPPATDLEVWTTSDVPIPWPFP